MNLPQQIVNYYTLYFPDVKDEILPLLDTHSFTNEACSQSTVIFSFRFKCLVCNEYINYIVSLGGVTLTCDEVVIKNILE